MTNRILVCGMVGVWLLVAPLWLTGRHIAPATPRRKTPLPKMLRIGVFTLFQPQEVRFVVGFRAATLYLDERTIALPPNSLCRVVRKGDEVLLWQNTRQLATGKRLRVAAEDIAMEVSGRRTHLRRQFRGTLTVTVGKQQLQLVVTQPLETVVAAVVSAELLSDAPLEAARALAVVVRSYLAKQVGRHANHGFDFCDSTHCQLFFGEQWVRREAGRQTGSVVSALGKQAAADTHGEVLWETGGALADTYFTACCGGRTTTPAVAFGPEQSSATAMGVRCRWCRDGRFFTWMRRVDRQALVRAVLPELAATEGCHLAVARRTADGFVTHIAAHTGSRYVTLPNHRFRHLVGRRLGWNLVLSNRYTIESQGEWLVLHGHGFGHQVGLCLAGAIAQARAERHYRDILQYYFPQAACRKALPADS
ncbi:MAG: SpoIID/LytB domain-containing protein [Acidobacteriota bacterium]